VAKAELYFEALGRFAHQFAMVEALLHFKFIIYAGIPQKIARMLTGRMALGDLSGAIKKMVEINGWDEKLRTELDVLLEQINAISLFRDRILHRGANIDEDTYVSTNEATYRMSEDLEVLKFNIDDLRHAIRDLRCINLRLFRLGSHLEEMMSPMNLESMHRQIRNEVGELFGPWQYKYVQPDTPNRPTQKRFRSQKRRRASSP